MEAKRVLSIQNMSEAQYQWLKKQADKTGIAMSSIVKMLVQAEMDKED